MEAPQLLTTTDNPINPFSNWEEWYSTDSRLGHNTPSLLARIADAGDGFDDGGIEEAMREIVRFNLSGKHIIVTARTFEYLHQQKPIEPA
jgi:hypothetical protein